MLGLVVQFAGLSAFAPFSERVWQYMLHQNTHMVWHTHTHIHTQNAHTHTYLRHHLSTRPLHIRVLRIALGGVSVSLGGTPPGRGGGVGDGVGAGDGRAGVQRGVRVQHEEGCAVAAPVEDAVVQKAGWDGPAAFPVHHSGRVGEGQRGGLVHQNSHRPV